MKVLITGASGFLGKSIVSEFSRHNDEVFTTSRSDITDFAADRHFKIDITQAKKL
jgi:nucleoside-diphosphate-sugar epimerase